MIDCYVSQPQYRDHVVPVWDVLPDRGVFYAARQEWARGYASSLPVRLGATLVAGHIDAMMVLKHGGIPILLEHGAGQRYVGHQGYRHPSNAGGDLRDGIGLFLCTNEGVARANLERYPNIPAVVIGSPRLDVLRQLREENFTPAEQPTLGLTWHWDSRICPESSWAFPEWGEAMRYLEWPGEIVGTAHPRSLKNAERWYARCGIRVEADWAEMVRQIDILSCDNSSAMFEAAALGIPVVVVNSARYRPEVSHGLRFWEWADIGPNVYPMGSAEDMGTMWATACMVAADYADRMSLRIAEMAAEVYPYQGEAAQRAADAIIEWAT